MFLEPCQNGWEPFFNEEIKKEYFIKLSNAVERKYGSDVCFPPKEAIFSAFATCPFNLLSVVILGQDPYPNKGQAEGLAFSVSANQKPPASLQNILLESGNNPKTAIPSLRPWSKQGVLLLNRILTISESKPLSHKNLGWERFTESCIDYINDHTTQVVFFLWGSIAQKVEQRIDRNKHYVLKSGHPSPLSANRGYWFGNNHFALANEILMDIGKDRVEWELPTNTLYREPTLF